MSQTEQMPEDTFFTMTDRTSLGFSSSVRSALKTVPKPPVANFFPSRRLSCSSTGFLAVSTKTSQHVDGQKTLWPHPAYCVTSKELIAGS